MARTDTLGHFLTDVADAIREKGGTSEPITASDFDTEIENLPSGGSLSDYFETSLDNYASTNLWLVYYYIKSTPDITIPSRFKSLQSFAQHWHSSKIPKITCDDSVTNMDSMFYGCLYVRNIDVSGLITSNVTTLASMFSGCTALSTLDVSNFVTDKVTTLSSTFYNCGALESLDLSNFNTPLVTNMSNLFAGCTSLKQLDLRNFVFDNVTNNTGIFGRYSTDKVPANCEIIVKSQTEKDWILNVRSDLTNVKTVAEYEAEQNQ